jgi:uncharacterized protein (DUF1778 family)
LSQIDVQGKGMVMVERRSVTLQVSTDEHRALFRAAKARGLSMSAYARRAAIAFAAHDLDLNRVEVHENEPAIVARDENEPRMFHGEGFGSWNIEKLRP